MKDEHLKDEEIDGLLRGNEKVRNRLILHHLAVCPECYAVAGYVLDLDQDGTVDIELGSIDVSLGRSRREAPALWEELSRHPFKRQKALVKKTPRFVSWGLAELLCGLAEDETPRDPGRARELAELAVEIASRIDEWEVAEPDWQHEIHAYALAHLGNAQRVLGDLRGAAETFAAADVLWQPAIENVGDVLEYEARYFALKASLRRAERKLPEALKLLDAALAASPLPDLRARILINQAKVYEEQGRIEEAIEVLRQAREGADEGDARLRLCLAQNHLDYLSKAERYVEAQAVLPDVEPLVRELGSESDGLRFRWTKARVARGLGRAQEAIAELEEVRQAFAALKLPYDAALCSLELAHLYAHLGQSQEAVSVVRDALTILGALRIEREQLMAVRVLTQAVEAGHVTVELISQVLGYLRRGTEPLAT